MSDIDRLEEKLRTVHDSRKPAKPARSDTGPRDDSSRKGLQAGVELVAGILGGVLIGLGLDKWLDTKPVFFLIFFFLGICTGFYNVYRVTNNLGQSVGFSQLHHREKEAKKSPSDLAE